MTLISIIIPLYNKDFIIEATLNAVLAQTYVNYEIIIINDGSTDNSMKVVSKFNDSRINIFSQENNGVSSARNLGIKKASGEIIAFLDADDYWYPNHLEEIVKLYNDFPNCGMYCNRYKIKTSNKHFQETFFRDIESNYRGLVKNYFYSNRPFRISLTPSMAIPKKIILEFNGFNDLVSVGEDVELWTKIGIKYPTVISNKITSIYNFNIESSLSKQNVDPIKFMNFEQFEIEENKNRYLKEFLDIYRFFYAIKSKAFGNKEKAVFYYSKIDKKNIGLVNIILFNMPSIVLKSLYYLKRNLKKTGIEFSTYN